MDWRDLGFAVIGFLLGVAAALWVLVYIANARAPPSFLPLAEANSNRGN